MHILNMMMFAHEYSLEITCQQVTVYIYMLHVHVLYIHVGTLEVAELEHSDKQHLQQNYTLNTASYYRHKATNIATTSTTVTAPAIFVTRSAVV